MNKTLSGYAYFYVAVYFCFLIFMVWGCGDETQFSGDTKTKRPTPGNLELPACDCECKCVKSPFQGAGGTHTLDEDECIETLPTNVLGVF